MKLLFIYGFNPLPTSLGRHVPSKSVAFATFRREYADEPVEPLYRFSTEFLTLRRYPPVLDDDEVKHAFNYAISLNVFHGMRSQVLEYGRAYEQFYLHILTKEQIGCVVNHNTGYAFQKIGHLIAKRLGLKTLVIESGYFRPYTLTIEPEGVNALSVIRRSAVFEHVEIHHSTKRFLEFYRSEPANKSGDSKDMIPTSKRSVVRRIVRELRQRLVFNRSDIEGYQHAWAKRIRKLAVITLMKAVGQAETRNPTIVFFLSSQNDPQLPLPAKGHIEHCLELVVDAFRKVWTNHPNLTLLIKEHPLDRTRVLYRPLLKNLLERNIRWVSGEARNLIREANGVIVMNSGIGVEALVWYKPVLCLMDSLYNIRPITLTAREPLSVEGIAEGIEKLLTFSPPKESVDRFLAAVYQDIQLSTWRSDSWKKALCDAFFDKIDAMEDGEHGAFRNKDENDCPGSIGQESSG